MQSRINTYYFSIGAFILLFIIIFSFVFPIFVFNGPIITSESKTVYGSQSVNANWGSSPTTTDLLTTGIQLHWGSAINISAMSDNFGIQLALFTGNFYGFGGWNNLQKTITQTYTINNAGTYNFAVGFGYWGLPANWDPTQPPTYLNSPIETNVTYTITYTLNTYQNLTSQLIIVILILYMAIPIIIYLIAKRGIKFNRVNSEQNELQHAQIPRCANCNTILSKDDYFCANCGFKVAKAD